MNPSTFGQNVTFKAKVDNASGTPTGNVTFYDGATSLGNVSLAGDSAQLSTIALTGGSHAIKAVYGGNANFRSDSTSITQTVNKDPTSSLLTSSLNPSTFGQSVTFKDSVHGSVPDGGIVVFKFDGADPGDSVALNGSGVATVTLSTLTIGTHQVQAFYGGTGNFDTSRSNTVSQIVKPDTFTIAASAGPGGSIAPTGAVKVARGSNQVFAVNPSGGYHIDTVFVDGSRVDSMTSYTFQNVSLNHTIHATFAIDTYTITASAGPNGTITPLGAVQVNAGQSPSFSITGNSGFRVADVLVDGVSVGRVTIYTFSNVLANHTISASLEVSGAYSVSYRSFRADSIALARDNKGKLGMYVRRRPDKVDFSLFVVNTSSGVTDFHADFSSSIDTTRPFFTMPPSSRSTRDQHLGRWDFTFSSALAIGDTVRISGFGTNGRIQRVTRYFWTRNGVQIGPFHRGGFFTRNQLKVPMPNRVNALAEDFAFYGFGSTQGLLVGKDRSQDSASSYGWLLSGRWSDVLKTLSDRTGFQIGTPRGFGVFVTGRPIVRRQTRISPAKFGDVLLADIIALKVSIVASALQKTPLGFGELIYNDGSSNPLNGLMIKEIAHVADSLMMGNYSGGIHMFASEPSYLNLDTTIQKINSAFEGPLDTVKFSDSLRFTGVRPLADVPFLRSNSSIQPERLHPVQVLNLDAPVEFELRQNYPNPFNPTTTIEFMLTNPAVVTLKVYNIVGQEIATLIDNQLMQDGEQAAQFDGSNLASGVYFYRITANQPANDDEEIQVNYLTSVKKMMLIK
ncbi:MAG: T9SS type A sorting domain-containing protein [Ignavibacteria bacterium]|nr:MAG: T9SS type A sorting domain-containing protein [Ignavibacteria bacterium]